MYLFLKPSYLYVGMIWLFLWWVSHRQCTMVGYCISDWLLHQCNCQLLYHNHQFAFVFSDVLQV